ncbi:hypothetical protein [Algicola sagamiensis]|uniref:hypothetical protein n=1 Tax=Algicola sagamiensis TaxID=163869 RepID=UPI000378272A|nr:hypothetical protein [Algicola sagamiensis]
MIFVSVFILSVLIIFHFRFAKELFDSEITEHVQRKIKSDLSEEAFCIVENLIDVDRIRYRSDKELALEQIQGKASELYEEYEIKVAEELQKSGSSYKAFGYVVLKGGNP